MAKVITKDTKEYDNFFRTGNIDTNLWSKSISGTSASLYTSATYDTGVITLFSSSDYSNGLETVTVTNVGDLRSIGNKFHFVVSSIISQNGYTNGGASTYAKIGNTTLFSLSNGGAGITTYMSMEVWITITGDTMNIRRKSYTGLGASNIVLDDTDVDISAIPELKITVYSGTNITNNVYISYDTKIFLSPIYFTKTIYGSKSEAITI